jgi:hypothetical protein
MNYTTHSNNLYQPLQGFYASTMFRATIDDYGNSVITTWPILEITGNELH